MKYCEYVFCLVMNLKNHNNQVKLSSGGYLHVLKLQISATFTDFELNNML